jgi:hypothetical protein
MSADLAQSDHVEVSSPPMSLSVNLTSTNLPPVIQDQFVNMQNRVNEHESLAPRKDQDLYPISCKGRQKRGESKRGPIAIKGMQASSGVAITRDGI